MDGRDAGRGPAITMTGVVGVVLVILKLTGLIDTSWWWVTAPFWGPLVVGAVIVGIMLIIMFTVELVKWIIRRVRVWRSTAEEIK